MLTLNPGIKDQTPNPLSPDNITVGPT